MVNIRDYPTGAELDVSERDRLKKELRRFPYLSDSERVGPGVERRIADMFDSPTSRVAEYGGNGQADGYFILRNIREVDGEKSAELVWIHYDGAKRDHGVVRLFDKFVADEMAELGLDYIYTKTASSRVAKFTMGRGFQYWKEAPGGFEWCGVRMPLYYCIKEK